MWLDRYEDRFFPGESANLTFQIVNKDCRQRSQKPFSQKFLQTWQDDLRPILDRLAEMNKTRFILNYSISEANAVVFGDRKLADWEIRVTGYCIGSPVQVEYVKVWFAWPRYGEALSSTLTLQKTLKAFDPIKYIFYRDLGGASVIVSLPFNFPADLPSDSFEMQPTITLGLRYPGDVVYEHRYGLSGREGLWRIWGAEGGEYGLFTLSPYRTFSLKITDWEGTFPLSNARLTLEAHIYPFTTSYLTNETGIIQVKRLPDFYRYTVKTYYTPPLTGQEIMVYIASHEALELASLKVIRTELYTFRVYPVDLNRRPLINASVTLELKNGLQAGGVARISNLSVNGYASFYLMPTGNYSVNILWRGVEVSSKTHYIGYHPTYGFSPPSIEVETNVSDLIVFAEDLAGSLVGAVFNVEGPTPESSFSNIIRGDGVLHISQQPVARYRVTAVNESRVFGSRVEASIIATPGESVKITLPIYTVRLRLLTMDEKPLPEAEVVFHTLTLRSDLRGRAAIPGVPQGTYELSVYYYGAKVFSGEVRVDGVLELNVVTRVCDLNLYFEDFEGAQVVVEWHLSGPKGNFTGVGYRLHGELLPDVQHQLTVFFMERGKLVLTLMKEVIPSEIRGASLRIPVSPVRFKVAWSDGAPFNGTMVVAGERYYVSKGFAATENLLHRRLNVSIEAAGGVELLRREVEHNGTEIKIVIPLTMITVAVHDLFEQPLEGVDVAVYSVRKPGYLAARGETGPDGAITFTRLPAALAPYRVEARYGERLFEAYTSAGLLRFKLNAVVVSGFVIPPEIILGGLLIAISLGVIVAAVSRLRARMSREERE